MSPAIANAIANATGIRCLQLPMTAERLLGWRPGDDRRESSCSSGQRHLAQVRATPDDTLLDVLRRELGLFSCRETCGIGLCGACTVLCDGKAISSCLALALAAPKRDITTAEGLVQAGQLHPVQQAFVDAQAFQCSFCTPGFVMSLVAMLAEPPEQRSVGRRRCPGTCAGAAATAR